MVLGCDWVSIVSSEPSSSDLLYKQKTKHHIHSILFHQLSTRFSLTSITFPIIKAKKFYQYIKSLTKFEKNLRRQLYIFMKNYQLTLQHAWQQPVHMMHFIGTTVVVLLSYYTVELQAWCIHCPISAQIRLVIISHIP